MLVTAERVHERETMRGQHPNFMLGPGADIDHVRKEGKHLSTILREIAITSKLVDWKTQEEQEAEEEEWHPNWWMMSGFGWEEWAVKQVGVIGAPPLDESKPKPGDNIGGEIGQPGEMEDAETGIPGTPDGYAPQVCWGGRGVTNGMIVEVVDEFKQTKKSAKRWAQCIEKQWIWLAQIKGYLWLASQAYGGHHTFARLHVNFSNGDYEQYRFGQAQYWRYWLDFHWCEIEDNWRMVKRWEAKHGRL